MFGSATIPSLDISPPILEGRAPLKARDPSLIPAAPHGNGAAAGLARLRSATRFATAPIPRDLDPRGLRSRHKGSHRGSRVSGVELVARVAKPPRTDVTQGDDVSPWDKPRLTAIAASTLAISRSPAMPRRAPRRALSIVLTCSSITVDVRLNPTTTGRRTCVGIHLPTRFVRGTTITGRGRLFSQSSCTMRKGRTPPYSLPTIGSRSAKHI